MYTVDYFIKKFEAIPEGIWIDRVIEHGEARCALGHCGCDHYSFVDKNPEAVALAQILQPMTPDTKDPFWIVVDINDGHNPAYQQRTPKERILAALYDIKKTQEKEQKPKEIIRYVSVPETIKEQTGELILS